MNEIPAKRKEWVKNAAIIFLTVMLILTFFSNTIMNYSLPEAATQAVSSGSITAKVRGTGTVATNEPYNIMLKESRVIESVNVKKGDVVEKGDVLFVLEDSESTELKEAEEALFQMVLDYEKSTLSGDTSKSTIENIEKGNNTSIDSKQSKVEAARNAVDAAEANVENWTREVAAIQKEIDLLSNTSVDSSSEREALRKAQDKLNKAQEALVDAGTAKTKAEQEFAKYGKEQDEVRFYQHSEAVKAASDKADEAAKALEEINKQLEAAPDDKDLLESRKAAEDELKSAQDNLAQVTGQEQTMEDAKKALKALDKAVTKYNNASAKVEKCQLEVTKAEQNLAAKEGSDDIKAQTADLNTRLIEANDQLNNANADLIKVQKSQEELLREVMAEVDLGASNEKIKKQQELVEKLRSEAIDAKITAPVAGTVTTVSRAAGESTVPEEALAVIQVADKGYTMSFAVTDEQAKKVSAGDVAELQNAWNYEDVKVTLSGIRPDPDSGGRNKLLVFDVTGSVQEGQELSISVGQKSANYDLIVPNSSIREDANGKFILTVESKSSPLGNRYIAARVDIEVLASDDNQSAISAPLYGYEYVITTSTKPVEIGKQIRLAD